MSQTTLFWWSRCLDAAPPLRCNALNQETAQKGWWKHASTNLFCWLCGQAQRCLAGSSAGLAMSCLSGSALPRKLALFEAELAQALRNIVRDESASQHHRNVVGQVPVEEAIAIVKTKELLPGDDVPEVLA